MKSCQNNASLTQRRIIQCVVTITLFTRCYGLNHAKMSLNVPYFSTVQYIMSTHHSREKAKKSINRCDTEEMYAFKQYFAMKGNKQAEKTVICIMSQFLFFSKMAKRDAVPGTRCNPYLAMYNKKLVILKAFWMPADFFFSKLVFSNKMFRNTITVSSVKQFESRLELRFCWVKTASNSYQQTTMVKK